MENQGRTGRKQRQGAGGGTAERFCRPERRVRREVLQRERQKGVLSDLKAKKLPLQEGKLLGFDDYLKSYKESDPGAFAPEKAAPTVTVGGKGQAPASSNQSFLDNKYKNNPFYHPKGE